MASIEIYTTPFCGFCHATKRLIERKGAGFVEHDVSGSPDLRREMTQRAKGRTSVPQVFIDGRHIGGCDDLFALERSGKLDPLLGN